MSLIHYTERVEALMRADDPVTLPFEKRQKTRLRIVLDNSGAKAGLVLPRGSVLRDGDLLRAGDTSIIQIIAAKEAVSTVFASDAGQQLACAAYHLGNRHAWVQIGDGWVRYLKDHIFDDMLRSMGYKIVHQQVPFEPEVSAYPHHSYLST